jgi:hypothetical protein
LDVRTTTIIEETTTLSITASIHFSQAAYRSRLPAGTEKAAFLRADGKN